MIADEQRDALRSDLSHMFERWFGPNLAGWPDNPTRYFGEPASDAIAMIEQAGWVAPEVHAADIARRTHYRDVARREAAEAQATLARVVALAKDIANADTWSAAAAMGGLVDAILAASPSAALDAVKREAAAAVYDEQAQKADEAWRTWGDVNDVYHRDHLRARAAALREGATS